MADGLVNIGHDDYRGYDIASFRPAAKQEAIFYRLAILVPTLLANNVTPFGGMTDSESTVRRSNVSVVGA